MITRYIAACLLIVTAACNSANPPHGEESLPDSAAAGMTNPDNNRTVYPTNPQDSMPNQSMIMPDTAMRDTRNHFVDTTQQKNGTSK